MNPNPSNSRTVAILASLLVLCIGVFYFLGQDQAARDAETKQELELLDDAATYSVRYQAICVECVARYTNETGGTDKVNNVSVSWEKAITAKGGDVLNLNCQNGEGGGKVVAQIYVNNQLVGEQVSTGSYMIATVSIRPKTARQIATKL